MAKDNKFFINNFIMGFKRHGDRPQKVNKQFRD